jgi:hypothetical protein
MQPESGIQCFPMAAFAVPDKLPADVKAIMSEWQRQVEVHRSTARRLVWVIFGLCILPIAYYFAGGERWDIELYFMIVGVNAPLFMVLYIRLKVSRRLKAYETALWHVGLDLKDEESATAGVRFWRKRLDDLRKTYLQYL